MVFIEFQEWTPDLEAFSSQGVTIAKNVRPIGNTYKPFPYFQVFTGALDDTCRGAVSGLDYAGNTYNFAGDEKKLYELDTLSWSDVSISGGYSSAADESWFFTQWKNKILATNFSDPMQSFTMGTSTLFDDLGGSPPQARYIATVRDFVVVANTFDGVDGNQPYRVRWSGLNDEETWDVSQTTLADFQDLSSDAGWVKQIIGGEYGTIFQEKGITIMTFIGSPLVFQFDQVEKGRGTKAPGSVIKIGTNIAYLDQDGFYMFDGSRSIPIGHNKIDKTVSSSIDENYLRNISSVVDPVNHLIYWAYPDSNSLKGMPNKIVMFNYSSNATKRWAIADVDVGCLHVSFGEGVTLDGLDSFFASIDSVIPDLDSRFWTGGGAQLSAFDSLNRLVTLTGQAMPATIETSEAQITPGGKTLITRVRPIINGGEASVTLQIGARDNITSSVVYSPEAVVNDIGSCSTRSNARYQRVKLNVTGNFESLIGIDIEEFYPSGKR